MPKVIEPLNGGMVTSRDPSMLAQGELQSAYNCMYYQDNEHLSRIPGVSVMADSLYKQAGLVGCRFTNGRHDLISQQIYKINSVDTGAYFVASAESNNASPYTGVTALTAGSQLVSVMADDRHYLFNGANENLVYLKDGKFRPHGLLPAVEGEIQFLRYMDDSDVNSAYHDAAAAVPSLGYYEYWYTEAVKFSDDQIIESTFVKNPITVNVTSLSHAPVLTLPSSPQNASYVTRYGGKLHYNIYRSEKKEAINSKLYPIGRKVGEVNYLDTSGAPIPTPQFIDTTTVAHTNVKQPNALVGEIKEYLPGSAGFSTTVTASGSNGSLLNSLNTGGGSNYIRVYLAKGANGWHDGTNGSWPVDTQIEEYTFNGWKYTPNEYAIGLRGFPFGTFNGNISGINVTVNARSSIAGKAKLFVMPAVFDATGKVLDIPAEGGSPKQPGGVYGPFTDENTNGPTNWGIADARNRMPHISSGNPAKQSALISNSGSFTPYNFGQLNTGTSAPAFLSYPYTWKLSNVGEYLGVVVGVTFTDLTNAVYVDIKSITMDIYYVGTSTDEDDRNKDKRGQYYDAVSVEQGGVQVSFGARNKAPIASTGTMFQGSLVVDSKDEPNKLYYSMPGFPDAFPTDVYWIELPGVNNDKITSINVVNDRLVVGTRGNLWRINYLPNQDDAGFSRGEAVSLISGNVGIVNPNAACTFRNQQGQQELAFVDSNGIFSTDGYAVRKLSQDLLWVGPSSKAVMTPTTFQSIYSNVIGLVNDPRSQTLRLITNANAWAGSYADIHTKQGGGLKWTKYASGDAFGSITSVVCIKRNTGAWVTVYGVTAPALVSGQYVGKIYREDSSDSTSYNEPMGGLVPQILTREISFGNFTGESSMDSIGIHGTMRTSPITANFTNIPAEATTTQLFTNAASVGGVSTIIPGAIAGSRNSQAGIDGVNCEEVSIRLDLQSTNMFEMHGIHMNVSDFGEADTSA